jgi:hypothetical protein
MTPEGLESVGDEETLPLAVLRVTCEDDEVPPSPED